MMVEVFVRESANQSKAIQYKGLYAWTERIALDKKRVDVKKASDTDPNKGYLWKYDHTDPEDIQVPTGGCPTALVFYPKAPNPAQFNFLSNFLVDMCNSLDATHADPYYGWQYYVDAKSWHEEWLLQQWTGNSDMFVASNYFWKDESGKAHAGPLWDIDLGYGLGGPIEGDPNRFNAQGWEPRWWTRLMADKVFVSGMVARWTQIRTTLTYQAVVNIIDEVVAKIGPVGQRDIGSDGVYADEITELKGWIATRFAFMDAAVPALLNNVTCTPYCSSVYECGWDGCGGSCGTCPSGKTCVGHSCVAPCTAPGCMLPTLALYDDVITNGYTLNDWSGIDWANHEQPRQGSLKEAKWTCNYGTGFQLWRTAGLPTEMIGFAMWIHGGSNPASIDLKVSINVNTSLAQSIPSSSLAAGAWKRVFVPFPAGTTRVTKIGISCTKPSSTFYIDQLEWVPYFDFCSGVNCNDNNPCTNDTCNNVPTNQCQHTPAVTCDTSGDSACQATACSTTTGTCQTTATNCDDGNACTADSCDPVTGCSHSTSPCYSATPSNACKIPSCNTANGACIEINRNCDDGNACTVDSCDPTLGCVHTALTCQSDSCNTRVCNSTVGCVSTPVNCDDANPCTSDTCSIGTGCSHTVIPSCGSGQGGVCSSRSDCANNQLYSLSYNYVDCINGHCTCLPTFQGTAQVTDKCRCSAPSTVNWCNNVPFCLTGNQCCDSYQSPTSGCRLCLNKVNGVGTCSA